MSSISFARKNYRFNHIILPDGCGDSSSICFVSIITYMSRQLNVRFKWVIDIDHNGMVMVRKGKLLILDVPFIRNFYLLGYPTKFIIQYT